jgi:outer membrane protein TolC
LVLRGLCSLFLGCSYLFALDISPLSKSKQKLLEIEERVSELESEKLKRDWIKPIIASYSYSESDQFSQKNRSRYFRISLDQPIFKSGGIYFAVKYSDASREFADIVTKMKTKGELHALYKTLLELKRVELNIKRVKLSLDSANIDVKRKREQFEASLLDSSFLDNALLKRVKLKRELSNLKSLKKRLLSKFKTMSEADYRVLELPKFRLISKDEFLEKNLELKKAKEESIKSDYLKKMTISSYLPTVSLFGDYSYQKDSFRVFRQNNEHKSYGIRVSMPIFDINRGRDIEIKKLNYLKSKIEIKEKLKEEISFFEEFKADIDSIEEKISLSKEDLKLYDRLLKSTKEGYLAGEKSVMDVEMMRNSKEISKIEIELLELDKREKFLELFAKYSDEI